MDDTPREEVEKCSVKSSSGYVTHLEGCLGGSSNITRTGLGTVHDYCSNLKNWNTSSGGMMMSPIDMHGVEFR